MPFITNSIVPDISHICKAFLHLATDSLFMVRWDQKKASQPRLKCALNTHSYSNQ